MLLTKETLMSELVKVLMERDDLTREEAEEQVAECTREMHQRLAEGEMPDDICEEYFGLEPDYLMDLLL